MLIEDYASTKDQTVRIPLEVNGEDGFIEVCGISSRRYADAMAWFKRTCSQKLMAGVDLFSAESVMGEEILTHTEEYEKLNAILFAHLVVAWSFDSELNLDNAAKLLVAHPKLCTAIDEQTSMMSFAEQTAKKPQ